MAQHVSRRAKSRRLPRRHSFNSYCALYGVQNRSVVSEMRATEFHGNSGFGDFQTTNTTDGNFVFAIRSVGQFVAGRKAHIVRCLTSPAFLVYDNRTEHTT